MLSCEEPRDKLSPSAVISQIEHVWKILSSSKVTYLVLARGLVCVESHKIDGESTWREKYSLQVNISFNIRLTKLNVVIRRGLGISYLPVLLYLKSNMFGRIYHQAK